jgi:hypothetical protein
MHNAVCGFHLRLADEVMAQPCKTKKPAAKVATGPIDGPIATCLTRDGPGRIIGFDPLGDDPIVEEGLGEDTLQRRQLYSAIGARCTV